MTTEIDFCTMHCGELTPKQIKSLNDDVKLGNFLGVGSALGSSTLYPMVRGGKSIFIIVKGGERILASLQGRQYYENV